MASQTHISSITHLFLDTRSVIGILDCRENHRKPELSCAGCSRPLLPSDKQGFLLSALNLANSQEPSLSATAVYIIMRQRQAHQRHYIKKSWRLLMLPWPHPEESCCHSLKLFLSQDWHSLPMIRAETVTECHWRSLGREKTPRQLKIRSTGPL